MYDDKELRPLLNSMAEIKVKMDDISEDGTLDLDELEKNGIFLDLLVDLGKAFYKLTLTDGFENYGLRDFKI